MTVDTIEAEHHRIESSADVFGGEPVLKGTRIPARHIADLVRSGASLAEVTYELDLTAEQVEDALAFVRAEERHAAE